MLLTALALAAQTATPSPAVRASMDCAIAVRVTEGMTTAAQAVPILYFVMLATRDDGGTGTFFKRYMTMSETIGTEAKTAQPNPALVAQCRKRTPKAWATTPVTLPADSYDRRLMCMGIAGSMQGVARSARNNGQESPEFAEIDGVATRFGNLIPDSEFATKGITTAEPVNEAVGTKLAESLSLGNLRAMYDSCVRAFPA